MFLLISHEFFRDTSSLAPLSTGDEPGDSLRFSSLVDIILSSGRSIFPPPSGFRFSFGEIASCSRLPSTLKVVGDLPSLEETGSIWISSRASLSSAPDLDVLGVILEDELSCWVGLPSLLLVSDSIEGRTTFAAFSFKDCKGPPDESVVSGGSMINCFPVAEVGRDGN